MWFPRLLRQLAVCLPALVSAAGLAQGKPQFIVPQVNLTGGQVSSLLTGSFQPQSGLPDILFINAGTTVGGYQVTAGELLNHQGFTNLTENQISFANALHASATVADFDGDGIADAAFGLTPFGASGSDLCVYYGTGTPIGAGSVFSNGLTGKSGCMSFPTLGTSTPNFSYVAAAPFKKGLLSQLILEDTANGYLYILGNRGANAINQVLNGFTVKATYAIPAADGPGPIYVGDFNHDGNTDFILNNQTSLSVSVYYGNGDGTFRPPVISTGTNHTHSILLADMDGDGIADLVAEESNGVIEIFHGYPNTGLYGDPFGVGDVGSTSLDVQGDAGNGGHLVAVGDVNHDGLPDILTTTPIGMSVLLGQGGQRYKLKGIYNIGPGRSSFALADFDGDGNLDVAVDSPEGVAIVPGRGDGSFATSSAYAAGQPALNATAGFFRNGKNNPNGNVDVAVATGTIQAQVLTGNGDGTFTTLPAPTNRLASPNPALWSNVLAGDFDGDGNQDLLYSLTGLPLPTTGPNAGSGLYVQYGNGDGSFAPPVAISPQAVGAQSLTNFYGESAAADVNGDGITDIVNIDADYYNILLSQKTGPFKLTLNLAEDLNTNESGDLDSFSQVAAGAISAKHTVPDLVFQDDANITPYLNHGDGTFTAAAALSGVPTVSLYGGTIIVADIDRDGKGDIIIPYHNIASNPASPNPAYANQLYIWYGHGDGTFDAPVITTLSRNYYLAQVVDMNGDGLPDVVLSDGYLVSIIYNQGNRGFGTPQANGELSGEQHFLAGQGINSISLADVNNDGSLDLIVANGGATISSAVAIGGKSATSISLTPNPDVNTGGITVLLNNIKTRAVTGTLVASPEPSSYPAAFTLTANLTPSGGVPAPTGTVAFSIDGVQVGSAVVIAGAASSTASYTVAAGNTYQGGAHTLTATYSGDSLNSPLNLFGTHAVTGSSTVTSLMLCVGPSAACPSTGLVQPPYVANLTMYYGQTFNGTAQAYAADGSVLTGVINFNQLYNGVASTLCQLSVSAGAECPPAVGVTIGTDAGVHVFTAVYAGDATHTTSTSPSVTITVLQDSNTGTLSGSPNPSPQGQPVTFTATFTGNFAAPTGTVTFARLVGLGNPSVLIGTATLVPATGLTSTATVTTSTLSVGTNTIVALYGATTNFAGASATTSEIILPVISTTTTLTSSLNPSLVGQSVTFTATTAVTSGTLVPTGTVTFYDGTTVLGTGTLVNGVAMFMTSALSVGSHTITATTSGDVGTASSSATLTQAVNALPPAGSKNFSITVTPSPVTIGVGNAASLTVTVTALNGFTQGVSLSCSNLPNESACTFLNAAIAAGGGSTTLLLSTMAPHGCGSSQPYFTGSASMPSGVSRAAPFAAPVLAGLAMVLLPGRRRWLRALIAVVALAGAMQMTGCSTCTDLGTRPNTYTMQVVGAAQGTSEVEAQSVTLNVTI